MLSEQAKGMEDGDGPIRLRFEGQIKGYGHPTRAATNWSPGDRIYLLFTVGGQHVTARATYHTPDASDPEDTGWLIEPDGVLTSSLLESTCQAFYFSNPTQLQNQCVVLNEQSIAYGQRSATCFYSEEGTLIVYATLIPMAARLRFRGTPGQQFSISGLAFHTAYDAVSASLTTQPQRIKATIGTDGITAYYYVLLADDSTRQLTITLPGAYAATRVMEATALQPAATGYITLPTPTQPGKWQISEPISGDDFPADEDWDNSTATYDPYAQDENWD